MCFFWAYYYPSQGSHVCFHTNQFGNVDVCCPDAGPQLIVRPFQWKGSVAFLRDFNRGAAHNELGMQAEEIVGHRAAQRVTIRFTSQRP